MMFLVVVAGCLVDDLARKTIKVKLPTIIYISLLSILISIPGFSPIAEYYVAELNKMNLLSLCTPILAYAGISIGKDLDEFVKQGPVGIVVTACVSFFAIFFGSVIFAQVILMTTGAI